MQQYADALMDARALQGSGLPFTKAEELSRLQPTCAYGGSPNGLASDS